MVSYRRQPAVGPRASKGDLWEPPLPRTEDRRGGPEGSGVCVRPSREALDLVSDASAGNRSPTCSTFPGEGSPLDSCPLTKSQSREGARVSCRGQRCGQRGASLGWGREPHLHAAEVRAAGHLVQVLWGLLSEDLGRQGTPSLGLQHIPAPPACPPALPMMIGAKCEESRGCV